MKKLHSCVTYLFFALVSTGNALQRKTLLISAQYDETERGDAGNERVNICFFGHKLHKNLIQP